MNAVQISGRLAADPELKHTQSGTPVTSFSVAVDRNRSQNGENNADFFGVVAWRGTAELVCKYWRKGKWIEVSGRLQSRSFEDHNGLKHKVVEIVAESVGFGGVRKNDGAAASNETNPKAATTIVPEYDPAEFEELNDGDLPF